MIERDGPRGLAAHLERRGLRVSLAVRSSRLEVAWPTRERAGIAADGGRRRRESDSCGIRIVAWEVAGEVRRLVHVDPESIDVDSAVGREEDCELVLPVGRDVLREPVGECRYAGPDDALPDGTVASQHEDVILDAALERRILLVGHGRVYHDDVVLVVRVEMVHELADFPR